MVLLLTLLSFIRFWAFTESNEEGPKMGWQTEWKGLSGRIISARRKGIRHCHLSLGPMELLGLPRCVVAARRRNSSVDLVRINLGRQLSPRLRGERPDGRMKLGRYRPPDPVRGQRPTPQTPARDGARLALCRVWRFGRWMGRPRGKIDAPEGRLHVRTYRRREGFSTKRLAD
jgi:hypothetical protein